VATTGRLSSAAGRAPLADDHELRLRTTVCLSRITGVSVLGRVRLVNSGSPRRGWRRCRQLKHSQRAIRITASELGRSSDNPRGERNACGRDLPRFQRSAPISRAWFSPCEVRPVDSEAQRQRHQAPNVFECRLGRPTVVTGREQERVRPWRRLGDERRRHRRVGPRRDARRATRPGRRTAPTSRTSERAGSYGRSTRTAAATHSSRTSSARSWVSRHGRRMGPRWRS
jgi:hypothetical protein